MLCSSIQFDTFFSAGTSSNFCGQGREAAHCLAAMLKRTDRGRRPAKQPFAATPPRSATSLSNFLLPDVELFMQDNREARDGRDDLVNSNNSEDCYDEEFIAAAVHSIMNTLDCGDLIGAEDELRSVIDDERVVHNQLCSGILHSILGFVLWEQRNMAESAIAFGAAVNILSGLDERSFGFSRNFHLAIACAHLAFFAHNDALDGLDGNENRAGDFEIRRNFDEAIRKYEKSLGFLEGDKHAGLTARSFPSVPAEPIKRGIYEGYAALLEDYAHFLTNDPARARVHASTQGRAQELYLQAGEWKAKARAISAQSWVVRFVH